MNTLRFPASTFEELRASLMADAPNEAAALVLAENVETARGCTLLVNEVIRVPAEFSSAGPFKIDIAPEFIARVLKQARLGRFSMLFAHSHPFATRAHFSAQDDAAEQLL